MKVQACVLMFAYLRRLVAPYQPSAYRTVFSCSQKHIRVVAKRMEDYGRCATHCNPVSVSQFDMGSHSHVSHRSFEQNMPNGCTFSDIILGKTLLNQ